jgi:hypothetical protein
VNSKEIFNQYFKRKLILCVSVGLVAIAIRLLGGHQTSLLFALTFLLFFVLAALIIGYIDYRFYETSAPKIIAQLLDKQPLLNFQRVGFAKEEGDKLEGTINDYKVILSPATNIDNDKQLIVLIPLQIKEGLENYFTQYDDNFRFSPSGEVIFAQAILKDYDTKFDFHKLFNLLEKTTLSLKENKIEPLIITSD